MLFLDVLGKKSNGEVCDINFKICQVFFEIIFNIYIKKGASS